MAAAFAKVQELGSSLSDYDGQSELSRWMAKAGTGPQKVSPELFSVLERAEHWNRASHGCFNVTAAPVIRLWRQARKTKRLPKPMEIESALKLSDAQQLILDHAQTTAELRQPQMRVDLGGIAKGFIGDLALEAMKAKGITRAMIVLGGDVVVGDPPPQQSAWKITVEQLKSTTSNDTLEIHLVNQAASTSGDAYQYATIGGKRYSHIIDPRTGHALVDRRQTTVIARRGVDADALATACNVMGPQTAIPWVDTIPGAACLFLLANDDGREVEQQKSSRWPASP
jgi:thiamine biosynthesis lipoprotein